MKPFMTNNCYHPHCLSENCDKCCFFNPHFKGMKVPRWLGKILFNLKTKIFLREMRDSKWQK